MENDILKADQTGAIPYGNLDIADPWRKDHEIQTLKGCAPVHTVFEKVKPAVINPLEF